MNLPSKILFSAAMGASAVLLTAMGASAAIVCRGPVCWHTHEAYDYPSDARVIVHPDDRRWRPREHLAWREHEGRGYWSGRRWTEW